MILFLNCIDMVIIMVYVYDYIFIVFIVFFSYLLQIVLRIKASLSFFLFKFFSLLL